MSEDRFRDLSPAEQRIAAARRDGEDIVDRQGRPRFPLGTGPQSQLVRAIYPLQQARVRSTTDTVATADVLKRYIAVATANANGLVLNTFVTVAWRALGGLSDEEADARHHAFLDLLRTWFNDKAKRLAQPFPVLAVVWCKEAGRTLGLHSHLLVHVPQELRHEFRTWAERAAHRLAAVAQERASLMSTKLRLVHVSRHFGEDCDAQWRVFRYIMKGMNEDEMFGLDLDGRYHRYLGAEFAGITAKDQGAVLGKRTGNSVAIGPKYTPVWVREACSDFAHGAGLAYHNGFLRQGELQRQLATAT